MIRRLWRWVSLNIISPVTWNGLKALFNKGVYWELTEDEHDSIRRLLSRNYFIILSRRKTHLTTYLISLGNFLKTGKFSYWSHALMNLEGDVTKDEDFRLMEATGAGTGYRSFMKVFDCDSVVLLKPKGFTAVDWTEALDRLRRQEGKPYDTLFDLANDQELSCVELVYEALENDRAKLPGLSRLIDKYRTLAPQMLYDCGDFDIVWEVRH